MDLLRLTHDAWGFAGLLPRAILEVNAFGNLLVEDVRGRYWRVCPEELACEIVAESQDDLERLRSSAAFRADWDVEPLVAIATALLGSPGTDRCFCLKRPAVLGGLYEAANFGTIPLAELIAFSGDLAAQIRDVPDGARVQLKIVD